MCAAPVRETKQFKRCVWRKSCCEFVEMSKVQTLRAFVSQRLSAAAEEIIDQFERTIAEYEEELCGQRKLLDTVLKPEVRIHRADIQMLVVSTEEQEDQPELPHIKEEQEELWTSQDGEQLQGLEETDIINFTFNPAPVKSEEDDEEKPQSSQPNQKQTEHMKTEGGGEDGGESEPAGDFNPDKHLQPCFHNETLHSSESEIDNRCDWEETREPQSGLKSLQNNEASGRVMECNTGKTSLSFSECAASFDHKGQNGFQTEVKPFRCTVCGKRYPWKQSLINHMRLHSEGKPFSCSVCNKSFKWKGSVVTHMRIHTGEKRFSCSVCSTRFTQKETLREHMRIHTGEKPFSCSVCGKRFKQSSTLASHLKVHTGEKPFTCSVCKATFSLRGSLSQHMRMHTGEKPFICSVCGKTFGRKPELRQHLTVHTGEKPFSCSVCGKRFAQRGHLKRHSMVHTGERPFSCTVCERGFTRLAHLQKHKCVGESSESK